MKIFLDDIRDAPDATWTVVRTPYEFSKLFTFNHEKVTEISFDHDLGFFKYDEEITGYHVLCDLEIFYATYPHLTPPKLHIHSANSGARKKMELAIEAIERRARS